MNLRPKRPLGRRALALLALLGSGCAAPLGIGRPATVIEPGRLRIGADGGMRVAQGALDLQESAEHHARGLDADADAVSFEDWRPMILGAAAGLKSTPLVGDLGLYGHYGVSPGWEVGGRLAGTALRAEAAWQFYGDPLNGRDAGWTGVLGLGWNHHVSVPDVALKLVDLRDVGRNDIDIPLLFGYRHFRTAYLTVGARYTLSHHSATVVPRLAVAMPDGTTRMDLPATDISGLSHHVGGLISGYLGIGGPYLGLEFAVGYEWASVRAAGEDVTVSSLAIRPALVFFLEI